MWLRLLTRVLYAPESTTEGALAAMNTALEQGGNPPASSGDGGDGDGGDAGAGEGGGEGGEAGQGDGDPAADDAAAGDGAASEQAGGEGADGGEGGQGGGSDTDTQAPKPGEAGSRHRADGTFKSKDELAKDAAAITAAEAPQGAPPAKGGKPDAGAKGGKKVDHVNDPIPDDVKGRTRERIEGLAATAKDLTTKLTAATTELESARELVGMIEATGADPDTFARHMDVLALMHSPDVGDKQQVLKYLRAAAEKIGTELGETPPGKNALEGHQDLIDEVEAGELTQGRAEEIAKARNRDKAVDTLRTKTSQQQQNDEAAERKKTAVKTALNGLTAELRKKDGNAIYDRKHKLLVPFIRRLNGALGPDAIVKAVREAYAALELPPAPKPNGNGQGNRAPAGTGGQQPMRHKQGASGGQVKQPGSALEAVNGALEDLAGGAR